MRLSKLIAMSLLVLAGLVTSSRAAAQEMLTVTFTATSAGGSYSPKNIDVVWVASSGGTFERTIGRWAGSRRTHLIAWRAAAGTTDVDAVSGATQSSYGSLTATWDLTDRSGTVIPDGTYTIRIESCDSNASTESQNHQGTFSFVKNGTASMQTTSGGGFNNVIITYSGRTAPVDAGMPVDMGMPPVDMGMTPVDMGMTPVDMGMPPVDMGMPPVDMGTPPEDMGTTPEDMGTTPVDMGTPPVDMGTSPLDLGTLTDSGASDAATVDDGSVELDSGAVPPRANPALVGTCSVSTPGSGPTWAMLLPLAAVATLLSRARKRR